MGVGWGVCPGDERRTEHALGLIFLFCLFCDLEREPEMRTKGSLLWWRWSACDGACDVWPLLRAYGVWSLAADRLFFGSSYCKGCTSGVPEKVDLFCRCLSKSRRCWQKLPGASCLTLPQSCLTLPLPENLYCSVGAISFPRQAELTRKCSFQELCYRMWRHEMLQLKLEVIIMASISIYGFGVT